MTFLANLLGASGCPDGTFQPDMVAHLCEALRVMYNCFSSKTKTFENPFADAAGKWYEEAAAYNHHYRIFAGDADPNTETLELGGERVLDLQTLCLLFCQTLESYGADCTPKETGTYTDTVGRRMPWTIAARTALSRREDGSIGAVDPVTRGEMADIITMLYHAAEAVW